MNTTSAQTKGRAYEQMAYHYLQKQGLTLIARNYHCRHGELDLIMRDGDAVVFIEVRYRASQRFGSGAESIDRRKQARLIATATHYLQSQASQATQPSRFDVVSIGPQQAGVDILWIKDAFQA